MSNTTQLSDLLENNKAFAATFKASDWQKGGLSKFATDVLVITCIDPRVPTEALFGIDGDRTRAPIARNAGGRPQKLLDSVFIGQALVDIKEILVLHHTGCGALTPIADPEKPETVKAFAQNNLTLEKGWHKGSGKALEELKLSGFDRKEGEDDWSVLVNSIKTDCAYLRKSPLVKTGVTIKGAIYDIKTGKVHVVEDA